MNFFFDSINFILALSTIFLVVHGDSNNYPTSKLNGLIGYAKEGGITGGWDGKVVMINTLQELLKNAIDNTPQVLVINSNIENPTIAIVTLGSNKSIIGSFKKPVLKNIFFKAAKTSENIIFQNLVFEHSPNIKGNNDIQLYLNYGKNYWIDHCSFIGHKWSVNDGSMDKLLYVGDSADFVTISNSYFAHHKYGLILGHPNDDEVSKFNGYPHLTLCNNYFEDLDVRAPGLMRFGRYHVYSNHINKFSIGFTVSTEAQVFSENNLFEVNPGGVILENKGAGGCTDEGSTPSFLIEKLPKCSLSIKYPYKSIPAKDVKAFVTANAGAQSKKLIFGS